MGRNFRRFFLGFAEAFQSAAAVQNGPGLSLVCLPSPEFERLQYRC